MHVMVVGDEREVREGLGQILRVEGLDVSFAENGSAAWRSHAAVPADAILVDVCKPGVDELEICRRIRDTGDRTPVLVLTGREHAWDRATCLEAGVDDYLAKPFAREELLVRLRALLRRSSSVGVRRTLRFGDLELDRMEHQVIRDGRAIELTRTEYLLLELFLRHPRQVLTRAQIFQRVWGYDFGPASNSLEVYVGCLRRKTEAQGEPRMIHSVRGIGYVLRAS